MPSKPETTPKARPIHSLGGAISRVAGHINRTARIVHAARVAQRHLEQQPDHILQDIGLYRWEIRTATRSVETLRRDRRDQPGASPHVLSCR